MKFSKDGYKRNSKDRNNPYNVIPSGNITMEGVDFPVFGMDNLGNSRVMMPGANYTFPGNSVFEIPLVQNGGAIDIPRSFFRSTERVNDDGSVSTHLMRAEQLDDGTWVGFPSLFENEPGEWYDMSGEEDWMKIYEEAQRRGQVVNFGKDKEAAIAFGEGSWKNPERYEDSIMMEKELPEVEVIGYKSPESKRIGTLSYISDDLLNTTVGKKLQTLPFVDKELLYSEYMNAQKAGLSLDLFNKERKDIIKKIRKSAGITKDELKDLVWDQTADLGFVKRKAARIAYNQLQKGFRYGGGLFKAQDGDEVQEPKFTINQAGAIDTQGIDYTLDEIYDFIIQNYEKVDTSKEQQYLLKKLQSKPFRDRYAKQVFNITGEQLSEDELTERINAQYDFTAAGPDFHVVFPYVSHGQIDNNIYEGYQKLYRQTPFINPFMSKSMQNTNIGYGLPFGLEKYMGYGGLYIPRDEYMNMRSTQMFGPGIPELAQYPYSVQLANFKRSGWSENIFGDSVIPSDEWQDTVDHEYAHSYNTRRSPLFKPLADLYTDPDDVFQSDPAPGYKNWLVNLFGENYFDTSKNKYGEWSMRPSEISSIKAENEAALYDKGIWDNTKEKFSEKHLNKLLRKDLEHYNSGDGLFLPSGPSEYQLNSLGYNDLTNNYMGLNDIKKEYENKIGEYESGSKDIIQYIEDITSSTISRDEYKDTIDPIISQDTFNNIFNLSQQDLKERRRYSSYNDLLDDYYGKNKRKKERATGVLNSIYGNLKTEIDNFYKPKIDEQQEIFQEKKDEVLPKMEMYFNEIAMDDQGGDNVLARYGKELPKASPGLEFIKNRYPGFNDLTPDEQNQVLSQYSGNEYIPQTQRPPQFSDDYYRLQEFRQNNPNVFGSTIGLGTLPDYAIKSMSRNPMGQIAIDEDMAKTIERTRGLDPKVAEQFRAMLSGRKSGKTMFVNYNLDDMVNSGAYTYDTPGQGPSGQSMKGYINEAGLNKLIELSGQMDQPNYPQLQDVDTSFTDKESKRIERENYMDPFGNIDPTSGGMIEIPQIEEEEENPFLVDPQSTITIPKRTVSNIDSLLGNTTDTQLPPKPQAPTPTVEETVEEDVYVPQSRRQSGEYIPQSQRRTGGALSQAQDGNEVKFEDLEKGIRYAESLNGELMLNPESTATGLYGQLWSEIKDMYDGTREDFSEDLDYQKKIFKDRANGLIEGVPGLIKNGTDIYNEYSDVEHGMSKLEIAALSNMLGRQGTRKYIGNHIRDGESLADVFPHLYGDNVNQTNKTPIEYIEKFNKGLLGLKLGGEIGKKLRRLKQQLKLYNEGKEISGIVRKELMDRGLIQPIVMQKGGSIEPYTIQQGDYLGKIASDNGLSVDEIVALNPKFKDRRSTIYPGEVVYFDEKSKNAAESNEPVKLYTIQKGDTLGEIASKHYVSLAEVAELNNLTGDQINRIYPGNQLIMPKHAQYIKNESTKRQEKIAKSPVTTEDTIVINEFNPINEVWVTRKRNEDGTYSTVGGKKQRVDEINLYDNYETIINAKNDADTSSSTETYTVKQGDTLSSIAGDRDGVTVNSIAYNNNIDNPNNIMVGQKLKIKKSASKPYLLVDKQKGKMHLLYPGEDAPRDSYDILLGTMIGDQATKTVTTYSYNGKELSQDELNEHMKDNGVKTVPELLNVPGYRQASFDQYGGNRMTGAGKYTISAANPDGGRNYRGDSRGALVPSFNLVSDAGIEQALAIHGVTRGRTSNLYDGIGTNNRLTTGCINGKCVDLQSLYDNPDIGEGTEVYILPEEEGSSFVYENGKLNFYTSKENQERAREGYYKTVKNPKRFEGKGGDEGEFVEGGPGINVTTDFGNYRPIQFEFDIDSYKNSSIPDGNENNLNDEYQQNTKPFLNALAKNKKPLMDLLNIDGDLYNNIALTAFGIYGNESGMGDINDPVEDFFQALRKGLGEQLTDNEYGAGSVVGKYTYANDPDNSVGWTQLRVGYGFTDPRERELLAKADEKFGTNFATPLNGSNGGYDDIRNHPDYNTLSKEDKEKAENNNYRGGIFVPRDVNGMPIKGMPTQYHMYKIDNSELLDQEKSALATMIILTNRYQTQIPIEEKNAPGFDIFNRLPLTWRPTGDEQTRQNYVNLVNKNMQFVKLIESDIEDFDQNVITKGSFGAYDVPYGFIPMGQKFKRGGEFGLDKQVQFYEDYVNDLYKNTNQEKSADKLYDKLNRMYYNDSKQTGRNTLDTMKAMNEQSNN